MPTDYTDLIARLGALASGISLERGWWEYAADIDTAIDAILALQPHAVEGWSLELPKEAS